MKRLIGLGLAFALLCGALAPSPARAEVKELRIALQPGVLFFPMWIMRENKLFEKHAARLGLGEVKTEWVNMTSGGANAEALISGNVDVVAGGVSNLLVLWSKSKGDVKAFAAVTGVPNILLTRDPNMKSIADFTEKNRIAVPTVKMSLQAIYPADGAGQDVRRRQLQETRRQHGADGSPPARPSRCSIRAVTSTATSPGRPSCRSQ